MFSLVWTGSQCYFCISCKKCYIGLFQNGTMQYVSFNRIDIQLLNTAGTRNKITTVPSSLLFLSFKGCMFLLYGFYPDSTFHYTLRRSTTYSTTVKGRWRVPRFVLAPLRKRWRLPLSGKVPPTLSIRPYKIPNPKYHWKRRCVGHDHEKEEMNLTTKMKRRRQRKVARK